ncbi:transposase [Glycomyces tenuis]|uniref:transposase n=1 Tax=Glycomyces tenuis TaxID=58116 RepID=UPI0009DBE3DD
MDAGKKIKGRKRHIVTDFLGLVLAVIVTAASVSDTAGGRDLVDRIAAEHPSVSEIGPFPSGVDALMRIWLLLTSNLMVSGSLSCCG